MAIRRTLMAAFLTLWWAASSPAQIMKLAGTSENEFRLDALAAQPCVLGNTTGTLTLAQGLRVGAGTVNFSGATVSNLGAVGGGTINGVAIGGTTPAAGAFTTLSASGVITSTLATGTAPLSIASTTLVANLNVDSVDGFGITAAADGGVLYRASASSIAESAAGTSGQLLKSGGSGSPTWMGLTSGYFIVGNGSSIPTGVAMSGDATLASSGAVTIANSAVTTAKLADAVADAIPTASLTAGSETSDVITVTFQIKDVQGNNLSAVYLVDWNLSDSSYGATVTTRSTTVAYSNGSEWNQITANKKAQAFTDSTGKLVLNVTLSGTYTVYLMAAVGGKVYVVTLAFSG